ncbi:uncharacterized protein B0I36DRAFT_369331 [Microdochium trichocladiopsis]|uniref:SnoaL-like domain-containing protein n=1 Tax=Microdochium trichocladiopsis TaxID=1682393 RepID=A0A9P8XV82_9PEZI|nr:uncharacterized protein B0I36DRAFT_369331 [Microdochium trichocladiopsis]KAH7014368.1 hypothetical protein B0I36DRAFT_369331 [Microdochium trichocladiopsis]
MRVSNIFVLLPLYGAAVNAQTPNLKAPPPCVRATPAPSECQTEARFNEFAEAFIVTKNITEAFTFIVEDYINHNPLAQNGSASAWSILSPIWASQDITVLGTKFRGNMGWLNYRSAFGTVVDRFRWEGGCIAEHWDQNETFPTD